MQKLAEQEFLIEIPPHTLLKRHGKFRPINVVAAADHNT
jgi:hypothetical protein